MSTVDEGIAIVTGNPTSRQQYLAECRASIDQFKAEYPLHWVEYIRGKRPSNYTELVQLRSWLRAAAPFFTEGSELDVRPFAPLIHQLVDEKLHDCRRPRGVVVAAVVLGKVYISYSLCNSAAGDRWSKPVGVWKAMHRIAQLKILPCPVLEASVENAAEVVLTLVDRPVDDFITWALQFPASSYNAVERTLGRILGQHVDDSTDLSKFVPPEIRQHAESAKGT